MATVTITNNRLLSSHVILPAYTSDNWSLASKEDEKCLLRGILGHNRVLRGIMGHKRVLKGILWGIIVCSGEDWDITGY
jgi:hypothetical protein